MMTKIEIVVSDNGRWLFAKSPVLSMYVQLGKFLWL